jgi:hypothetical protein
MIPRFMVLIYARLSVQKQVAAPGQAFQGCQREKHRMPSEAAPFDTLTIKQLALRMLEFACFR